MTTIDGGGAEGIAVDAALAAEESGWTELRDSVGALTPEEAEKPGYYVEGWSAKDLLAHIGAWLAEGGVMLERIRAGTYRAGEVDVDHMNALSLEAMRDVSLATVKAQAAAARTRMRHAWSELDGPSPDATFWIAKSGPEHYDQHLPRLQEWVEELHAS